MQPKILMNYPEKVMQPNILMDKPEKSNATKHSDGSTRKK